MIALQETKLPDSGIMKIENVTLFMSGPHNVNNSNHVAQSEQSNRHQRHGVAFAINNKILPAVKEFKPINDRLCTIKLRAQPRDLCIINCYAPTEEKDDEVKDEFYDELERTYDGISSNHVVITMGDFNAQVGKESIYRPTIGPDSLHDISNQNGQRLINFAIAKGQCIVSTYFPRKRIHKYTWTSPDGATKNQIDHIMINATHKPSIKKLRTYRGVAFDTDHHMVGITIKQRYTIKRCRAHQHDEQQKFDIEKLKIDQTAQAFLAQTKHHINNDQPRQWDHLVTSLQKAADETIGRLSQTKSKPWFDELCKKAIEERNLAYHRLLQNDDSATRQKFIDLKQAANKLIRSTKRKYEKDKIEEIENNRHKSRQFFRACNQVKKTFNQQTSLLENDQGDLVSGKDNIVEVLKSHFNRLLNAEGSNCPSLPPITTTEQWMGEPTLEEVSESVTSLSNNKAPGDNMIVAEMLKKADKSLLIEIHRIITEIWSNEKVPEAWNTATIIPIFKKGDKTKPVNYRGISLLDIGYKVFTNLLNRRLVPYAEEIVGKYQCGFRRAKSTLDHIFTIGQIIEKNYEFNVPTIALFIDFKQAYDRISRESMWHALASIGIPSKYINLVKACYDNTTCKVKCQKTISDSFLVKNGLRQGDPLAPTLFNLVLEYVMRNAKLSIATINQNEPTVLAFADDIVIVGNNMHLVKSACEKLIDSAAEVGLTINETKTQFMVIDGSKSNKDHVVNNTSFMEVRGLRFAETGDFKYLGVVFNNKRDAHQQIKERVKCANRCYYMLEKTLKSKLLSHQSKIRLYLAYIRPVLTYGCEAWTLCKNDRRILAVFERKVLRKIFGPVFNPVTNEFERRHNLDLYERYGRANILSYTRGKRIEWLGHVWRDNGLLNEALHYKPAGTRGRGRPKERWFNSVTKDLVKLNRQHSDPQDRDRWKQIVGEAMDLNGPLSFID